MNGEDERALPAEQSSQLCQPKILRALVQMREHRNAIDQIKELIGIRQGRLGKGGEEACGLQVFLAPLDGLGIHIGAVNFHFRMLSLQVS